ncbi:GGDEF domain-containing protein [Deinococcus peraridilitoris]|uniref:PAS domain S-box/diguanylate cyclase (GGDEF) domain-containing protein n=1 Tax=Deinococcus peraridilitoris (strain DSM 19664 / LMG 22246 / CIP 109416 / KR-200) TaxID=937777 RepID=L0A6T3_DEIPD|nr:GGDEF domain-containing protein [Deinococcus peraridilitoris]AFZ69583.1 PAS domain S-box/diguanylate cyclase (GGDEF) domain-containing protein [Deinococcus peraridilitoris DSM 19664]
MHTPTDFSQILTRAVHAATNGLIVTQADGDFPILYCNPAFETLTGYPASEILGRNCRFLQGPGTDAYTRTQMREALCAGLSLDVVILNYRRDGTPFWNALNLAPIHDEQGRVTHFVGVQTDVTDRVRLQRALEKKIQTDDLTGLGSRASFLEALQLAIQHSASSPFAVGFADLDDFKRVNDSLGHEAGDELLRHVAIRLRESVRKGDLVARLAGDEFVLLLRELEDCSVVEAVAKRALQALERPFSLKGLQVRVGASLGFVVPSKGVSAVEVLSSADRAMYDAKHQGKNRFVIQDCR